MSKKYLSMMAAAKQALRKATKPITFEALLKYCEKNTKLSHEEIRERAAQFYTDLSIDNSFINLEDNRWDLSERHQLNVTDVQEIEDDTDIKGGLDDYSDEEPKEEENSSRRNNESTFEE